MTLQKRHDVRVYGYGPATIVCVHGFACDQTMWRFLVPSLSENYTVVTYDLAGCGGSDPSGYDDERHCTLHGHALDLIEIVNEFSNGPTVVMGHSMGAMVGMLATIKAPERFTAQVMVAPSPCSIKDTDYPGAFSRDEVVAVLDAMDADFLSWCDNVAALVMGAPDRPVLAAELAHTFVRNTPEIVKHLARVAFLSDHRADVRRSSVPALILQSSEDRIAPPAIGEWMKQNLANSTLHLVDNVGHCPHMSAPSASTDAIAQFLARALR